MEYINCKFVFFLIVVKTSMEVFSKFCFRNHSFKRVNLAKVVIVEKFAFFCVFCVHTKDWSDIPESDIWTLEIFFLMFLVLFFLYSSENSTNK